jgi:hypothetical protein
MVSVRFRVAVQPPFCARNVQPFWMWDFMYSKMQVFWLLFVRRNFSDHLREQFGGKDPFAHIETGACRNARFQAGYD